MQSVVNKLRWHVVRLDEVALINPESVGKSYPHKAIQYIDISSVGSGTLSETALYRLSEAPSRAKRLVKHGDTILSTVRPNRRSFLFIKSPAPNLVVSTGFAVLRQTNRIDARFLYYAVTNPAFTDYLAANMKGAAYPAVDTETIARATIALPPLAVQRKIAAILSAYDDLIENNTRRIQILEEMAQTIYREWFVKFRFPGHENVTMVDSELGPVPEGWESKTFSDIAELSRDGINPSTFEDELFTHYSFPAFDNGQMPILERGTAVRSNKYIVVHDSVLLSKLNPRFPRVWLPVVDREHRAIASTEFLVLKPKPPTTSTYLFSLCRSPEFFNAFAKHALGTSTSHQRVKPDDLFGMPILALHSTPMPIFCLGWVR